MSDITFFNLQSLSSPSSSATLLPPLLSPTTQKQIQCLSFMSPSSSIMFSDILMLCPLWIVYSGLVRQENASLRIFWCTRQSVKKPDLRIRMTSLTFETICLTDSCAATYPNDHMTWKTIHTSQFSQEVPVFNDIHIIKNPLQPTLVRC